MEISRREILNDILFLLFFPFLSFDLFLFYGDGVEDLAVAGRLWLLIFVILLAIYAFDRKIKLKENLLPQVADLIYMSFIVFFFSTNIFLAVMFVMIVHTNSQFLL